jgi:gliding motility-associated-like protein
MLFFGLPYNGSAQYLTEVNLPSQTSPCDNLPVEITLYNDGGETVSASKFQLEHDGGFSYLPSSLSGEAWEDDIANINGPIFNVPAIEACESVSFLIWLSHICANTDVDESFIGSWDNENERVQSSIEFTRVFGVALRMIDIRIYLDTLDFKFKKAFSLVNTGKVPLESFVFFVEGEDNMDILNSSHGQLSGNGDTLYFDGTDFVQIGNSNEFFEPGERIDIVQEIDLNACQEAFPFVHKMRVECGGNSCVFEVSSSTELMVEIANPRLYIVQQPDQNASPCDTGEIELKLINFSSGGSFPQANALYNLDLNTGWSVIQGGRRTTPRRDNCLRVLNAYVNGTSIPIRTAGYTGYGLDFRQLTSDPDGMGGLTDIDGDGRYDDLYVGDTIFLKIKYVLDPGCLNIRCSGETFASRLFRVDSEYENYCEEEDSQIQYINRHNYFWSGVGGSVSGLEGIYSKGEQDTLTIRVVKNTTGFLTNCDNDSAVIRIFLPRVMSLPPGAIILVNGDTATYDYFGNRITIESDTNRYIIQIPVDLDCDPNSGGGGGVQTACTFCLGSGLAKYRLRVEVDYFCGSGCYGKIPLACFNSPEFFSVCDGEVKGIVSEGKFVIEQMNIVRQTLGYSDSTKMQKPDPATEDLDLGTLMTFDTFLLEVPFDIRCDADYTNLRFRLIQNPIITIINGVRDTAFVFDFISDTLKFYDGETGVWSKCDNVLGPQYFNTQNDGYRNRFIKNGNFSNLACLSGTYSSPDSLVLIVKAVVKDEVRNNVQRLQLRTDLDYTQDGCDQNSKAALFFNVFSGVPNPGAQYINQPYQRDTNYKRFYPELSVCGNFQLYSYVDAIYFNIDTIDPFQNEHRQPFKLEYVTLEVSPFFELDSSPFNYIKEFYNYSTRTYSRDTLKIPFAFRDSMGYTLITFVLDQQADFESVRHIFRLDLTPSCYGSFTDTIRVLKKFDFQAHSDKSTRDDGVIVQKLPVRIASVNPIIGQSRQQFLFDSISVTEFELSSPTAGYEPDEYFDFHHSWMILDVVNGNVRIDSLVEYTDSTTLIHVPQNIGNGQLLYLLDTIYLSKNFRLHSTITSCLGDTIMMYTGNSCHGYPSDLDDLSDICYDLSEKRDIILLPEVPDLGLNFLEMPDSTFYSPCDTFNYLVEVRNSDLGHVRGHRFYVNIPSGMTLIEAEIEYPDSTWQALGLPISDVDRYYWDLSVLFDSTGFKGFYSPEENYYKIRMSFVGDCDIADGAVLSSEAVGLDLCNEYVSSGEYSSIPLLFYQDSLSTQQDLYDLKMTFEGDTLCGDNFTMRLVLTSKSAGTFLEGQQLTLYFRKELSYVSGSYQSVNHVDSDLAGLDVFESWERLFVDVSDKISIGDSVVFLSTFERTCIGVCKPTDFIVEVLTPKSIGCTSTQTGMCRLLLSTQKWSFDSVSIAPYYKVIDGFGDLVRLASGAEVWQGNYLISNESSFTINNELVVRFYSDINGDGQVDPGDLFIGRDTFRNGPIQPFGESWISTDQGLPEQAGCSLMAVITPLDNPCLCNGDTIVFPPLEIVPQVDHVRACFDQNISIGFDSIAGYSYQWLDAQKVVDPLTVMTDYIYNGMVARGGNAFDTVMLHAERRPGCSAVDTVFIELYRPMADAVVRDSILCHGDRNGVLTSQFQNGDGPFTYLWNSGDTTQSISDIGEGSYSVIITDVNGCADTANLILTEPDSVLNSVQIMSDYNGFPIRCNGDSSGVIEITAAGGTPDYMYEINGDLQSTPVIGSLRSGWSKYKVTDANGCWVEDSIYLDGPPPIDIISASVKAGCDDDHLGQVASLATGGVENFKYEWNNGMMGDSITGLLAGIYVVTATDANGCQKIDTIEVEQHPDPSISVNILDSLIEYGKSVRLTARSNRTNAIYVWSPSEILSCDTCEFTVANPTENVTVLVKVVDENGCVDWAEIELKVKVTKRVWAPNAFTPNGDGINDGFTLFGNPSLEVIEHLNIFDRWGELVFSKSEFEPGIPILGWDGKLREEEMNPAVFAWTARVRFVNGETETLFGDVTLIR